MISVFSGLSAGLQFEFINPIFEFSKGMNDLHLDEAEYALLIAINIFSAGQFDTSTNIILFVFWWVLSGIYLSLSLFRNISAPHFRGEEIKK